jgi:hypothetical protein
VKPGQVTAVSAGTLQGVYRPQVRVYYHNKRFGVLFETITKKVRCRSRVRAIQLAKEWIRSAEGTAAIDEAKARILANSENSV